MLGIVLNASSQKLSARHWPAVRPKLYENIILLTLWCYLQKGKMVSVFDHIYFLFIGACIVWRPWRWIWKNDRLCNTYYYSADSNFQCSSWCEAGMSYISCITPFWQPFDFICLQCFFAKYFISNSFMRSRKILNSFNLNSFCRED